MKAVDLESQEQVKEKARTGIVLSNLSKIFSSQTSGFINKVSLRLGNRLDGGLETQAEKAVALYCHFMDCGVFSFLPVILSRLVLS